MKAIADMTLQIRTPGDIGAAIRARRRTLGWDQAELAERIGVSRLWINQIEGGKSGAGIGLVLRTFNALELTLSIEMPSEINTEIETSTSIPTVDLDAILEAARKKPSS